MKQRRRARPRWGQNFLVATDVARHIVDWAGVDDRRVLEIGPGRGALTGLLLERAAHVRAVEIDPELAADLRRAHEREERLEIFVGDVLELSLDTILEPGVTVVANLPYESATAILRGLLEADSQIDSIVVMVQREVCQRLAAGPGARDYGLLALHTQLRADVETGRVVPPGCFRPMPQVESQLVRLRPLGKLRLDVGDPQVFRDIAAAAFRTRRKMLRNSVEPFLRSKLGPATDSILERTGLDLSLRPELLALEDFARLSALVTKELRHGA